jgi:hypothetical protein
MKLNLKEVIGLIIWLYKVVRQIIKVDGTNLPDTQKHRYVKDRIMPYIRKKGWDFNGDDVDRIINGLVWFVKKVVMSINKKKGV